MKWLLSILCAMVFSHGAFADNSDSMNFRFAPVPLIVGAMTVNFDFAVGDSWTLGPELSFWHRSYSSSVFSDGYKITSFGGGVRANWFNNGIYTNGLYVGPSLTATSVNLKASDTTGEYTANATVLVASSVVGYAWFWKSFNMMLGGGLNLALGKSKVTVKDPSGNETSSNIQPFGGLALEYSLGWTF